MFLPTLIQAQKFPLLKPKEEPPVRLERVPAILQIQAYKF